MLDLLPSGLGAARMSPRQEAEAEGGEEDQGDERSLLHSFQTGEGPVNRFKIPQPVGMGRAFQRKSPAEQVA